MVFPVVMYRCESWTIKKAKRQRIDTFKLWCWRRLLRVPWAERRPNQSILKEINPEYSLEGLMLKLQYFGHLMWRANSLEKTLMLGKIEGRRRRGWQDSWVASSTQWTWVWTSSRDREAWHAGVHGVVTSWTWLKWLSSSSSSMMLYYDIWSPWIARRSNQSVLKGINPE